jgi:excinuclease ABC subunit B
MGMFKLKSDLQPKGDQPQAIETLVRSFQAGNKYQTLLGVTGSGKTFTMAKVIERLDKPALVISHNKTLAAQLFREFKTFFPENAVEYFVSYYDYYQPESYVPHKDLYIEKDSSINEEIDQLRLRATTSLLERRDAIIVASVSCIYGLGSPDMYKEQIVMLEKGKDYVMEEILRKLVQMQYSRNTTGFSRGNFRVRGDVLDIYPSYEEGHAVRIEFFDRTVENVSRFDVLTNRILQPLERAVIYPAKHFVTSSEKLKTAVERIRQELAEREEYFKRENKLVEQQRIHSRTMYDIEMLLEMGYCQGIENYSRHIAGRPPGSAAETLLAYFPDDFVCFIDESHVTIPQLKGMFRGDQARKKNLVEYGFRLPSAYDNRPLYFEEFLERTGPICFVSATPGDFEEQNSTVVAEQVIRPTGLVDPIVMVRPAKTQVEDLLKEVTATTQAGERTLVTTLTKKMAEDLSEYFIANGIKAKYLHSEIDTLERVDIIRDLRKGVFDCLIGVNLLREGLDMPEVSFVAVLDADKEGFLRSQTSLIQTAGRAARNINGRVILYADEITGSMKRALEETSRRREKQLQYNRENGITPASVKKTVVDIIEHEKEEVLDEVSGLVREVTRKAEKSLKYSDSELKAKVRKDLERKMLEYARNLEFEKAAALRDLIKDM